MVTRRNLEKNSKLNSVCSVIRLITIIIMSVLLFSSCRKEAVTSVTLNESSIMLPPGSSITLIATIYPDNASNKNVTWNSDNPKVATVNKKGLVTAYTEGYATITVTTKDGNFQATCKITVDKDAPPPSDYRAKWVGTYDCEEINNFWIMDGGTRIDTFQTTVIVTVTEDSLLTFLENRIGNSYEAKVDKKGYFFKSFGMGKGMSGNFIGDSLYMEIGSGMQGYTSISTYKGKKK